VRDINRCAAGTQTRARDDAHVNRRGSDVHSGIRGYIRRHAARIDSGNDAGAHIGRHCRDIDGIPAAGV
jgi:hypothetical protein